MSKKSSTFAPKMKKRNYIQPIFEVIAMGPEAFVMIENTINHGDVGVHAPQRRESEPELPF